MAGRRFDQGTIRAIYSFWGRYPAVYRAQDWVTMLGRQRAIRAHAIRSLNLRRGADVLEVGCGPGINFDALRAEVGATGTVDAVDATPEMVSEARALVVHRGWENCTVERLDAAEIDRPDTYDAALALMSLSVVPRFERAIEQIRDCLKPGGVFVLADGERFRGRLDPVNALLDTLYEPLGAWHSDRDLPGAVRSAFGNATVERYNFGTFYIVRAVKQGA